MKKSNSIKNRVIFISLATIFTLFLILTTIVLTFGKKNLTELELKIATANVNRAFESYNYVLRNYEKKIIDWGEWDDTYKFIEDLNKDYISSNLGEETLVNLHVDEMLFFDIDGKLKFATASSDTLNKEKDYPEDVEGIMNTNGKIYKELTKNKITSGLMQTEHGVLMYTAHQILKSDGQGPTKGYIFFGRYVGIWLEDDMSLILQIPTKINYQYVIPEHLKNNGKYYDIQVDKSKLKSTIAISIDGGKSLFFEFETKLDLLNIVTKNARYLLIFILTFSLFAVLLNFYVIKRFVLDEVYRLGKDVSDVADYLDKGEIDNIAKTYEIYELRSDINKLIRKANSSIFELNRLNKLMVGREVKMKELKDIIKSLKERLI